jgi:hypothetical protein
MSILRPNAKEAMAAIGLIFQRCQPCRKAEGRKYCKLSYAALANGAGPVNNGPYGKVAPPSLLQRRPNRKNGLISVANRLANWSDQ